MNRAALAIAGIEYPDLYAGRYVALLDYHAAAIADRTSDLSDGERFVEAAIGGGQPPATGSLPAPV